MINVKFILFAAIVASTLPWALLPAQESTPLARPAIPLNGPYVFKVDWTDTLMKTGDLNQDGRQDWFTINNGKSLMTLYLSKSAPDDAPFDDTVEKQEIVMEKLVMGAAVGDVTGDGRADVLLSGTPAKLSVMVQTDEGTLRPPDERDPECQYILLDERGDSSPLLYAFDDNRITVYSVSDQAHFTEIAEYFGTSRPRGEPAWMDANNDGIDDIVYLDANNTNRLLVRERGPEGLLLPEQAFDIGNNVSLSVLTNPAGSSALLAIDAKTRVLKLLRPGEAADSMAFQAARLGSPRALGFDKESHSSNTFMELGDFNGDGRQDVLLVTPDAGNLRLFYASNTMFTTRKFPAFEGLRKARYIPPARNGDRPLIAVVSKTEKVVAFSRCHEDNRIDFPQPAVFDIEPINFEIADVDGNGRPDFLLLGKTPAGRAELRLYANPDLPDLNPDQYVTVALDAQTTAPASSPTPRPTSIVASIPELPDDIRVLDLNQDNRPDLALFFEFDKPRLFLQSPEGAFHPAALNVSVQESVVANMTARNAFSAALPQTPHRWTFLARANFLRAFSLDAANAPIIYQQFNGKNNRSSIERAAILGRDAGRDAHIALLDTYNKVLTIYHFDKEEWHVARHLDLEAANWIGMAAGDLNADGQDDLLLLATDRLVVYMADETPIEMDTALTLKSDIEDGYYAFVKAAPLGPVEESRHGSGQGGREHILLLENMEHLLELFEYQEETMELTRRTRFKVFSGDDDSRQESGAGKFASPEPREIRAADVNGDGIWDLLLLTHDKVIVYLGNEEGAQ